MPASSMPGWASLSDEQVTEIIHTLKGFSKAFADKAPAAPITVPPEPPRTPDSIDRGAAIYAKMGCAGCHGPAGHGDGPASSMLHDDAGNPIHPADFTKRGVMKCGDSAKRIYTTFMTGMNGTPMPSFDGQLGPGDAWDLVHFVMSLH
jgi:cytochrome c oxidase cbb3-type subunit 2